MDIVRWLAAYEASTLWRRVPVINGYGFMADELGQNLDLDLDLDLN